MADSPQHVAIIMDGNGRWARSRGLPRPAGHRASVKVVRRVVEECARRNVQFLTLFAFSSENWSRPADEVGMLMSLFLDALVREIADLHSNQVRLRFIGDRSLLGPELAERMLAGEALTQANTGLGLLVAVAYGGRWGRRKAAARADHRIAHRRTRGARGHSGSGSADTYGRGAAHQQLPAVESCLHRAVFLRRVMARIRAAAPRCGIRVFRPARTALRQDIRPAGGTFQCLNGRRGTGCCS